MHKIATTFLSILFFFNVTAQVKGDEDKDMFNAGTQRDEKAVKTAVDGWWTASMKTHDQRIAWWRQAKFGMFIHWGIYSLPGGEWKGEKVNGYAEHLMRKEKISRHDYLELAHQFNPVQFNADQWVKDAHYAGMRYLVITAKHHDGFAMYPSEVSDFNISRQTPFKKDPMMELRAACKKQGMYFGFYYSHAFDWEDPDAPGNDWEYKNPGGDLGLYGGTNWYDQHPELLKKVKKYIDEKAIPQIVELLKKYQPDILWFDTPHKIPLSENIRILEAIRKVAPDVVVNGRLVRSARVNFGDYKNTADRPAEFYPVDGDWEAIPTTNESYGYHKYDRSHKPAGHFVRLLASAAAKGGNLLMNIGPKGDGSLDQDDVKILKGIGQWMHQNAESIYGTTATPLPQQSWGVSTFKNNMLYLHVFDYPADGKLYIGGLASQVNKAYLLENKKFDLGLKRINEKDLMLTLPAKAPDSINTVVALELGPALRFDSIRFLAPNTLLTRMLAYDAVKTGKEFSFGDGKTNRYYLDGWKSTGQLIAWLFRISKTTHYNLLLKYIVNENCGGSYEVLLDDKPLTTAMVEATSHNDQVMEHKLGDILLKPGVHHIQIKPLMISKQELMKPLEIQLIQSKK